MRDRSAARDVTLPNKIYLSRSGIGSRKLANENDVELVFQRHGFTIVHPEALRVEMQIALIANALLVAGPSGSGMFNLAFQGRMRSAFILVWDKFIQLSEMLFSAGRDCDLWYHIGHSVPLNTSTGNGATWTVDLSRLEDQVTDWLKQAGI
jgi:capsular polysaccharide biosynthesis protein